MSKYVSAEERRRRRDVKAFELKRQVEAIENHLTWKAGWDGLGFTFTLEQLAAMNAEVKYENSLGSAGRKEYYEARAAVTGNNSIGFPSLFKISGPYDKGDGYDAQDAYADDE